MGEKLTPGALSRGVGDDLPVTGYKDCHLLSLLHYCAVHDLPADFALPFLAFLTSGPPSASFPHYDFDFPDLQALRADWFIFWH
jgi:hypothetical protein